MSSPNELSVMFKNIMDELFNSKGFKCRKLFFGNDIFYCLRDILSYLNYSQDKDVITKILNKLRDRDKFTIEQLREIYSGLSYQVHHDSNNEMISFLNQYEKNYIFINNKALYYLIDNSDKEETKPFKYFIYYTLLPSLDSKYKELLNKK